MASAQDLEAIRAGKEAALRVKTTMKELGFSVAADPHTDKENEVAAANKAAGQDWQEVRSRQTAGPRQNQQG